MRRLRIAFLAALTLALVAPLNSDLDETRLKAGGVPNPVVFVPDGEVAAQIVLLSDKEGWSEEDAAMAATLRDQGAIVVGIDQPSWLAALQADEEDCAYLVAPIESISKQLQRRLGDGSYRAPIIAGRGAGGALALAIAAQTPDATVERTVAIDPESYVRLEKELCTPADKESVSGGIRYGLPDEGLTNTVEIHLTGTAEQDAPLVQRAPLPRLSITRTPGEANAVLLASLSAAVQAARGAAQQLPLAMLDATGERKALAIIISGDGGWRDIDQQIARFLKEDGIPSVGLDALRYFWRERTPQETALALQSIMDSHGPRTGAEDILLIGYSFGANVLPATYLALDAAHRARVQRVSLLSIEKKADFQVSVLGWAGKEAEGRGGDPIEAARAIGPGLVQCIYGEEDAKSGCPSLEGAGAEIIKLPGGHHFDGDYKALTGLIVASYDRALID